MYRSASTARLPSAGNLRIDPARTAVTFKTKHMFGTGTVHGTFRLREGNIQIGGAASESHAQAVIDTTSFHTGNARRDKEIVSSKYLDTANYPDITFSSGRINESGAAGWTVSGSLTVQDTVGQVELRVDRIIAEETDVIIHASTEIDRYAFGIAKGKGLTGRKLHVDLTVVARRD